MRIAVAVAVAKNGVIGHQGRLPWHLPEDLRRFKSLTMGHTVIMGRLTFQSIGRPLPRRRNIVLSSRGPLPGVEVMRSLPEALGSCRRQKESVAFAIGGFEVFRQALQIADLLYLTRVDAEPEGDTHFPPYDPADWSETSRTVSGSCTFIDFVRKE